MNTAEDSAGRAGTPAADIPWYAGVASALRGQGDNAAVSEVKRSSITVSSAYLESHQKNRRASTAAGALPVDNTNPYNQETAEVNNISRGAGSGKLNVGQGLQLAGEDTVKIDLTLTVRRGRFGRKTTLAAILCLGAAFAFFAVSMWEFSKSANTSGAYFFIIAFINFCPGSYAAYCMYGRYYIIEGFEKYAVKDSPHFSRMQKKDYIKSHK